MSHDAEVPARHRRPLGGSVNGARSMLLTILGELVLPSKEPVWTASLLYVLTGLGIAEQTARQAITRAEAAGWISAEKQGREVRWRMAPAGIALIEDITQRLKSLSRPPKSWDGQCMILAISVPNDKRPARKPLYSALGWAGWGNPAPGLWINPHIDRLEETQKVIDELGLRGSTISFVGSTIDIGLGPGELVARGWRLDEVAARYAELLSDYEGVQPEPGDDLLFTHLTLIDEWRKVPYMDPQLPQDLLPDWIGRRAAGTFVNLRRTWAPGVHQRWREIVSATTPAFA